MDNSIQIMTTTALDVHLYNLRTYRYTPVSHGEPPSHGATVYGKIPPTYNNSNVQQSCVTVSQPLQEVATNVHSVQLSTADNTFHIYGICLNRNCMIKHIAIMRRRLNRHLLNSSNRTNRCITLYFKGYAFNEYPLNGAYPFSGYPKILGDVATYIPLNVCNVLLPTGNLCPRWTLNRFPSNGYHEML